VAGIADSEWGQRIAAFVVPQPGSDEDADELKEWVRSRLRGSKTPDVVVYLPELPTTPTGKILRRTLVELLVSPADA
jgi:acyl-CoA synthetase (AMP-forming)/AMP-acid ligase II